MPKLQIPYNLAKKKESIAAVPQIMNDIKKWEEIKRTASDPFSRKAADARLQALKIKMKSYKQGDPVKDSVEYDKNVEIGEEAQGAVTTGSIGASTMSTSDGGTTPAIYGNSSIYAPSVGVVTRYGKTFPPKKVKKKKVREFIEFYNQD